MRRYVLVLGLSAAAVGCSAPRGGREPVGSTSEAVVQCPTGSVEGIDVFDGQGVVDWSRVADAGIAFAFIKATQGTYDTQATFADNWAGAGDAGIRRGAYHFFDPTEDGDAQAAHFLSVVGALRGSDLAPMLDVECPDGDPNCLGTGGSGLAPAADIAARTRAFLAAVEQATGRLPIVYTFATYFASNAIDAAGLDAFPLFLAYPTANGCFPVPPPWSRAELWQYSWTGEVPGVAAPVDRDRWIGDLPGALSDGSSSAFTEAGSSSSSVAAHTGSNVTPMNPPAGPSPDAAAQADAGSACAPAEETRAGAGCRIAFGTTSPGAAPELGAVGLWLARCRRKGRPRLPERPPAC